MERTLIGALSECIGKTVSISGWVDVRRDQGKMVFFDFRDRSGSVQAICLPNRHEVLAEGKDIRSEFVVRVEGVVNRRPEKNVQAEKQNGELELEITGIEVFSRAEVPFELNTETNIDTYLDHQPYTLRSAKAREIFKVQETIIQAFRDGMRAQDFVEFQAQIGR